MPSINIYTDNSRAKSLENILPELRKFTAQALSCEELQLKPDELGLRVIVPFASLQIADTEVKMNAYHFPERIKNQNMICLSVKQYLEKVCPEAGSVYVWLQLSELGHSAER